MFNKKKSLKALIFAAAVAAMPASAAGAAGLKKCRLTFPEQRANGFIEPGAVVAVREWAVGCTGLFTASVSKGRVLLEARSGSEWVIVHRAISATFPQLPPGTYRLSVANNTGIRLDYAVRYRVSGG
jgi:hypothetical protein